MTIQDKIKRVSQSMDKTIKNQEEYPVFMQNT